MSSEKSRATAFLEKIGLKERDPRELVKEWTRELRREQRMMDRELRQIEREELKMQRDIKMLAKKGEMNAIRPLARSIAEAKKTKTRINVSKAHMNSITLQLRHQAAQLRMAQVLQSSTKVMSSMNALMKIPQISKNMHEMAMEMERAGLIEEIMDDAMDSAFDTEGMDDEVDKEVDNIISELTAGILDKAPAVPQKAATSSLAEQGKQLYLRSLSSNNLEETHQQPVLLGMDDIPVAPTTKPVLASTSASAEDGSISDLDRRLAALRAG
mmetsp:Transcript_13011/g.25253  ORF Transcript_13011/g.25253 Transcript_13011/m.25253 type:complete len:270 (-) Transcript_13011:221-1030(-)|eukprot:CAMPEP_0171499506 /NCGR_PEP_ID=MMETSP0958-20121227/8469_1 /TAXON_ID=87120 /ORGANISM="Aurantiochytrium limacinum, Strain ATCCMYA-1381" /LENGTH=269 /DNA_ID=CAMNT_0012034075 /DNA_START=307 /DNA_END=1116 /DNA_ORIENTATION=-